MVRIITHRHPGKYRSSTPKGRTILKKRPIHSQAMMDKSYSQLKAEGFRVDKLKDYDGDGVPNYKDCRPLDINRQDNIENYSYQRMKKYVEKKLNRKLTDDEYEKIKEEMKTYIFKKYENKEWKYDAEKNLEYYKNKGKYKKK